MTTAHDAADHTAQLERLAEATHRIHASTTARAALDATIEVARAVLRADASISIDHAVTVATEHASEAATHEQVLELPSPHAPSRGTLTLRRAEPFDRAELLIASQIARATALVLERHRLVEAVHVTARARQEIVNIVSHDLRTPVHAFALGLDALRATVRSEAAAPIFSRLDRSVRSMRRLLSDLLDVATIQDGTLPLHLAPHSIAVLLGNVQAGCAEIAMQKGLSLTTGDIAAGDLACDGPRIEQALTNLVGNALKYTEHGAITLTAIDEGDALCFEVSDTGIGMDADVRTHLFERLYQGPRVRAGGVGLGLYIVRGIARAHGGRVAVTSQLGRGSRFFMRIPHARTLAEHAT